MKNLAKILTAATVLGAASVPALADGFFYGAADIGQTKASNVCNGAAGCTDTAGAIRVAGGYQFVPNMGAELSYGAYGKSSVGTVGGVAAGDWKASGFEIAGIGALPLTPSGMGGSGFFVTGKVGLASTKLELTGPGKSVTNTNLAYGIGVRYDFNRDVGVRLQYESLGNVGDSTTGGASKLTLITGGVVAKF